MWSGAQWRAWKEMCMTCVQRPCCFVDLHIPWSGSPQAPDSECLLLLEAWHHRAQQVSCKSWGQLWQPGQALQDPVLASTASSGCPWWEEGLWVVNSRVLRRVGGVLRHFLCQNVFGSLPQRTWSPTWKCKATSPLVWKIYPFLTSEYWPVLPAEFNLLETGENAYRADSGGCWGIPERLS